MTVRAKFKCNAIEKRLGWGGQPFNYAVKFSVVTDGSPENKAFYASSPGGSIEVSVVAEATAQLFEVGKEYYVDFSAAPVAVPA